MDSVAVDTLLTTSQATLPDVVRAIFNMSVAGQIVAGLAVLVIGGGGAFLIQLVLRRLWPSAFPRTPTAEEIAAAQRKDKEDLEDRRHYAASSGRTFFEDVRDTIAIDQQTTANNGILPDTFISKSDELVAQWPAVRRRLEVLRRDDILSDGDDLVKKLPTVYREVAPKVQPFAATAAIKGGEHVRPQVAPILVPLTGLRFSAKALYEKLELFMTRTGARSR